MSTVQYGIFALKTAVQVQCSTLSLLEEKETSLMLKIKSNKTKLQALRDQLSANQKKVGYRLLTQACTQCRLQTVGYLLKAVDHVLDDSVTESKTVLLRRKVQGRV